MEERREEEQPSAPKERKREKKKTTSGRSPRRPWLSWRPTSSSLLAHAELQMLKAGIGEGKYEQQMVEVGDGHHINTIIAGEGDPLVIMHGFAAGIGLFVCNIKELARHHKVYALDMIGFGRSSRPKMRFKTPEQSEDFFLLYFEAWREALRLDRFILVGHSLGGYLSSLYTMRYPEHIEHLILADMWGILPRPDEEEFAGKWRLIKTSLNHFTPLAPLRFAGPLGPNIIHKLRPDMVEKFAHLFQGEGEREVEMVDMSQRWSRSNSEKRPLSSDDGEEEEEAGATKKKEKGERTEEAETENRAATKATEEEWELVEESMMEEDAVKGLERAKMPSRVVVDYIYHINARTPATGEQAFRKLLIPINWPVRPLIDRLHSIDPSIPITFLFGSHSWIDPTGMFMLQEKLPNETEVIPIHNAGHHLYVDNIAEFNGAILETIEQQRKKRAERVSSRRKTQRDKKPKTEPSVEELLLEREVDEFVDVGSGLPTI